jgi:hypothetical protein
MPESKDRQIDEFEEEEREDAADLPDRQAMSLLNPTSLLGGTTIMPVPPTQEPPTAMPAAGAPTPPVAAPGIVTPHLPPGVSSLPPVHPGDTYQPDSTDTSKT